MTRIVLSEYSDSLLDLTSADLELLLVQLKGKFDIRPSMGGDSFVINPGSTVGVIQLPSGQQLELRPKVPLRNLLWMLSYAYDVPFDTLDEHVTIQRFEDIIDLVADAFARMVEHRIDLGLYRNYVEEEANLAAVRGRILIAEDVHRNAVLRHRTFCRYTAFSWDLPENQVIRQVVHLLSGWGLRRPKLTGRLLALDSQLHEVSPVHLSANDVDRFVYNRQSEDYRPIHHLCRFFLEGASLSEEAGDVAFDGFLLDMNVLFERFVTQALRDRITAPFHLSDQVNVPLDRTHHVQMRPDLVVSCGMLRMLVADCKYKRLSTGEHKHHDLYQLLAYCTAMELFEGMLIYPRHLVDIHTEIGVRGSGITIREYSVDLSGSVDEITSELNALSDWISTLIQPSSAINAV